MGSKKKKEKDEQKGMREIEEKCQLRLMPYERKTPCKKRTFTD